MLLKSVLLLDCRNDLLVEMKNLVDTTLTCAFLRLEINFKRTFLLMELIDFILEFCSKAGVFLDLFLQVVILIA